jgi:hypothetical protein
VRPPPTRLSLNNRYPKSDLGYICLTANKCSGKIRSEHTFYNSIWGREAIKDAKETRVPGRQD